MGDEFVTIALRRGESGLGFNIRGGDDHPHISEDKGIFVSKIREKGAAGQDGRLKEGDKILELNGRVLENLKHDEAVHLFIESGEEVVMKVWPNAERIIKTRSTEQRTESSGTCPFHSKYFYLSITIGVGLIAAYVAYRKLR